VFDLDERRHALELPQDGHDVRDASVRELQRRFMVDTQQAARVSRIAETWYASVQPKAGPEARRELQRRFMVDTQQAARVSQIAETLYASVQPKAGPEARRELLWACALHETGMMISHHDHHRHSAYVLTHVDAAGFSQSQLRRIGELVLGQRGGLRKLESSLATTDFAWQALCLRLAIIKCHARGEVTTDALRLQRSGNEATLVFATEWADSHPRTLFLLSEEAEAWQRGGTLKLLLRS
jgi:exopolyphosphatase / guanosine-5'-triphosphate,3'-diphosphate pyrophosphatase